MARKTEAELVDRVSQILEDTGNAIFADAAQIQPQLQDSLKELSDIIPLEVVEEICVSDSAKLGTVQNDNTGREIDISGIDNLISVQAVEYPVDMYPRRFRKFDEFFGKVFLDKIGRDQATSQNDPSGDEQLLTGTVTFTSGSSAVSGSGTAFTSELEVGYYISPSGSSNWYRVATITDDTNLVIAINCASSDTGADSSGGTRYWFEKANLFCNKVHYVEATQTDLAGAVNNASGYAEGCWQIAADALGTGSIPKDMFFSIAGTEGLYKTIEAATITTNAATLKFKPRLKGRAENNAVITFYGSSLTPSMEAPFCDLVAGRVAQNWVGDARTAMDTAVTAIASANTAVNSMTARLTQNVTDIGTIRTAASANFTNATTALGDVNTYLDDANDAIDVAEGDIAVGLGADAATVLAIIGEASGQLDLAVTDISDNNGLLDANLTAISNAVTAVLTQLGLAISDTATARGNLNQVPVWGDPVGQGLNTAGAEVRNAQAKLQEILTNLQEGTLYSAEVNQNINVARGFISEANAILSTHAQLTQSSLQEARERIRNAYGSIAEASGYLNADASKVNNLLKTLQAEAGVANSYLNQASGYYRGATANINASRGFKALLDWANLKIQDARARLERLAPSVRVTKATTV